MNTTPPPVPDADPAETAAAIAVPMRRLAIETSALTSPDGAPEITTELLMTLREMASVTTHLARLSFHQPAPAPSADSDPDALARRATTTARAANGFNDATNLIYLACQPLASAKSEATRLLDRTPPGINAATEPGTGSHRPGGDRHHAHAPDRGQPTPKPSL